MVKQIKLECSIKQKIPNANITKGVIAGDKTTKGSRLRAQMAARNGSAMKDMLRRER